MVYKYLFFIKQLVIVTVFTSSLLHAKAITMDFNRGDSTYLSFRLPTYILSKQLINGDSCVALNIHGIPVLSKKGMPALPFFTVSLALAPCTDSKIEIVKIVKREIFVGKMIPSKGSVKRNQDPSKIPHCFSPDYFQNILYPSKNVSLSSPYIMRDIRGVTLRISPAQYNGATGMLTITDSMVLRFVENPICATNILRHGNNHISRTFESIYRREFLNYPILNTRNELIDDSEKMAIIAAPPYVSAMSKFVDWKNQKGIQTTLYTYGAETGTGCDALGLFIDDLYANDGITYLLLVGDVLDIPSPTSFKGLSDPTYTKIVGDDDYPDIFIGRFSVNSSTSAANMVDKAIHYEMFPEQNGTWYQKAIGHASKESFDIGTPSDCELVEDMRMIFLTYGYTTVDKVYEEMTGSISTIVNALNNGRGWYNYMGHGTSHSFGFDNAKVFDDVFLDMTNEYKNPVIISVACSNGRFDISDDCIAESATKVAKKGAIAFLGSSVIQPWVPPQVAQKKMVELIVNDSYMSLGAIIFNGSIKMLEEGFGDVEYLITFNSWILFGDPSLMVYTKSPTPLDISYTNSIEGTNVNFSVGFGESIDGRICFWDENVGILASASLNNDSNKELLFTIPDEVKTFKFTVTARNKMPFIDTISTSSIGIVSGARIDYKILIKVSIKKDMLFISIPVEGLYTISLRSISGKIIRSFTKVFKMGDNTLLLKDNVLGVGMYIMTINGLNINQTKKVIMIN